MYTVLNTINHISSFTFQVVGGQKTSTTFSTLFCWLLLSGELEWTSLSIP